MQGGILWLIFFGAVTCNTCLAGIVTTPPVDRMKLSLAARAHRVWAATMHDPDLTDGLGTRTLKSCEASAPAQPLATPNPLLDIVDPNTRVKVSFIIGTDGHVYSPLILESAGPVEDRTILDAVRTWRYRPAMCNGAATETEAKVQFSSR